MSTITHAYPMTPTVVPHEINFILDTQQPQPIYADPKMLHYSGIVLSDWGFYIH
ncbi:hypothetical protein OGM63_19155 [Plectonema radiosum NIES-515]|uniref:Uncharacterized protein n=1 Tax=Plectonema radiosum NIES-515 TaxID=2986073 RepID=A0ABT3B3Z9_9CYAN|nr:hypothetical protein [Plectonema radiosum]MCV3215604.1 hypothetical protein [Plectonema radiosum NIES-515]